MEIYTLANDAARANALAKARIRQELEEYLDFLCSKYGFVRLGYIQPDGTVTPPNPPSPGPDAVRQPPKIATSINDVQYVTLDQAAAMVHRAKKTLANYGRAMPPPAIKGRRGQPHLWKWAEIRPWLEDRFFIPLPEQFPAA